MVVVSIAKGSDPYNTTIKALRNLLEAGVQIPKITVIKPNVLSIVDAIGCINTSLGTCEAAADFLISLGNEQLILAEGTTHGRGDRPLSKTFTAFRNNGFYKMKGKISRYVDLNLDIPGKWIRILSPGLDYEGELGIASTATENPVASVAKLKTHDFLGLTLAMKNMMGSICQARKVGTTEVLSKGSRSKHFMHGWGGKEPSEELTIEQMVGPSKTALAKNLITLTSQVKPLLGLIDGVVAMEGDGPISGISKNLGVTIASTDVVACDSVACEVAGFNVVETGYIYAAGKIGLGEYRLEEIEIVGEKTEDVRRPLGQHSLFPSSKFSREAAERLAEEVKNSS